MSVPDHFLNDDHGVIAWVDEDPEWPIYVGEKGGPIRLNAPEALRLAEWLMTAAAADPDDDDAPMSASDEGSGGESEAERREADDYGPCRITRPGDTHTFDENEGT